MLIKYITAAHTIQWETDEKKVVLIHSVSTVWK